MTSSVSFVKPHIKYNASYQNYILELKANNEIGIPFCLQFPSEDFKALVQTLIDAERGIGLPEGFVPHSTYWLIDENFEVIGVSNIRHFTNMKLERRGGHIGYGIRPSSRGNGFGNKILSLSLIEAKMLGLKKVLLSCNEENIASKNTIIRNNGIFDSKEFLPEYKETILRFWIEL